MHPRAGQPPRLGLYRVQAFTEHSILFGLYCSIGVANFFYIYRDELAQRLTRTGLAAFMTFMSLSSAPVIALGIQFLLIAWDRTLKIFAYRWYVLVISSAFVLAIVQLGCAGRRHRPRDRQPRSSTPRPAGGGPRSSSTAPLRSCATRSSASASATGSGPGGGSPRSTTSIWPPPCASACRPSWHSASASRCTAIRIMRQRRLSDTAASYRRGYVVVWVGLIFVLATVNIWGAVSVMVMAYIGAGRLVLHRRRRRGRRSRRAHPAPTPAAVARRRRAAGPARPSGAAARVRPLPPRGAAGIPRNRNRPRHDDRDLPQAPRPAHPARAAGPLRAARHPDGGRALRDLRHRLGACPSWRCCRSRSASRRRQSCTPSTRGWASPARTTS